MYMRCEETEQVHNYPFTKKLKREVYSGAYCSRTTN